MPTALPDELVARFRAVSFERLERIDAAWVALTTDKGTVQVEKELFRDLHTLKGDARVLGFVEVSTLCQRVEDLIFAARDHRYHVHEDVDIVVTMAVQFIGMLLRKKSGAARGGIDLEGFLKQIEEVLSEWLRRSSESPQQGPSPHLRLSESRGRVSPASRDRMSIAATSVYLEYLRASGASRDRLRQTWESFANELTELATVPLRPWLEQQAASAMDLARELGKSVEVSLDVAADLTVGPQVLDAFATAVVHAIRNAIDHGIEAPRERVERGKRETGALAIRAALAGESVELTIVDDGAGIDGERIRLRAVDDGILTASAAEKASTADLHEILFRAGFSTRPAANDVSGRGIGLDAARAALDAIGGSIAISSDPGVGANVLVVGPRLRSVMAVHAFAGNKGRFLFAVPASWTLVQSDELVKSAMDPVRTMDLPPSNDEVPARVIRMRRTDADIALLAGGVVRSTIAERLCPTPDYSSAEVLRVDGEEALLIHPNVLWRR